MNTFNIATQTTPVDDYDFHGNQLGVAVANDCERAFRFRYIAGNVSSLPKYILSAIREAGYTPVHLGGTTYSHSVIGLQRGHVA